MNPLIEQKQEVRKLVRQLKKQFTEAQLVAMSEAATAKLEALSQFRAAKVVLAYWSLPGEVFTHQLIEKYHTQKIILLPKVEGQHLTLHQYQGPNSLVRSAQFGIMEPLGLEFTETSKIDLIIVPGMAFGADNTRLGRGKGFYDRLLAGSSAYKVGIAFPFQIFDTVPCEEHDVLLDAVIT